uniref:ANAPC4_WD40 domain-containing protein n=1 Tax=Dracunculus medinensis TaxID=318479 RepID=A0A0N4ULH1_DRAME
LSLKWTTAAEPVFAVSLLDGTLSVISIDRQVLNKFTIIATVQLNCNAICISWSPKGQQLVIGDTGGNIKQYKPDLVIVRTIPLPNDQYSVKNLSQCVGICWLTTTDFLVAYSTKRYMEVFVSLICAKKGVPIKYTHFDDIIFCGNESPFQQQITFLYLIQWKMVLVASSRSSEIAVIGKRNDKWKVWVMDDNERIELPVNKEYKESFPLGLAIDYSSIISLLSFSNEFSNEFFRPSEILPSLIYMSSTKESTQENSTYNKTSASSFSFTFPESVVNSTPSQQKSPANVKVAVISTTLKSPLNIQEASTTSEVPFSFSFPAAPETNVIQVFHLFHFHLLKSSVRGIHRISFRRICQ